jgi:hypothetical protein
VKIIFWELSLVIRDSDVDTRSADLSKESVAEMPPELSSFEIGRKVPRKRRPSGRSQGAQYDEATLPESPAL